VIPTGQDSYFTKGTRVETLCWNRIPAELPQPGKPKSRNPVRPRRILTELLCPSYEEGSQQAERPSSLQSLTTLPTRLHLATTLRMIALQVEFPTCGVCVLISTGGGIYRVVGELHRLGEIGLVLGGGRVASHVAGRLCGVVSTNFLH
jgi:hypothetical protein